MNAIIAMKSAQIINNERNETELMTEGIYQMTGDTAVMSYLDSEATGFDGSETKVQVTGNRLASITRTGAANSHLVIETGKKHYCHYAMPFGEMTIGIYTHQIKNELTETGGKLFMKYTLDMNGSYLSDNEIRLSIQKA
ncbi:MAG: DUF1934 domain-containing protein [Ruminococcus sp.]|nr:DUF1934 domain-containing protein [Ruminococcus sp.]